MKASLHLRAAVFLFLVFAAAAFGPDVAARDAVSANDVQGDVNCSGAADSIDSLQILRSVAGLNTNAACLDSAGDVNCDSAVNSVDSLRILRFVAGLAVTVPPGCTPIGDPLGPPPSSFDLIDEAQADGDIDSETALTYKVYATFGDDALPPAYKGNDSGGPPDSFILSDVQSRFDTLSQGAQATLAPFLIPPAYKGSWASPQGLQSSARVRADEPQPVCNELDPNWQWQDPATAKVRIWWQTRYPDDEGKATQLAAAMDNTIWPKLTGLMGEPLSDAAESCNGGNGRLDMYLALEGDSPLLTYGYGCDKTPGYIELNRTAGDLLDLSHEFMHAIQLGYDVQDGCVFDLPPVGYRWLGEATATWAADYVYPDNNAEQRFAGSFLSQPGKPLETYGGDHEYGAYLFFQYLTKFYGFEQIIRTVWNNTAQYGSLEAVEQAIPGGFEERWAPFAACIWNSPPSDCFAQWDQLGQGVENSVAPQEFGMGAATISHTLELTVSVEHMAAHYRRFVIADDQVHSVVFKNTLAAVPHAAVQALAKINGEWQGPLDWTDRPTSSFCRDVEGQHIEELVIIISNSDWEGKGKLLPPEPPTLTASSGCTSVTISWDANVADVDLQLWVLPQSASNLDEARDQEGQPGYASVDPTPCLDPFKAAQSAAIGGVTAEAEYISVYWWGWCSDRQPDIPPVVPFTITIQYADGRVEETDEEFIYEGPYVPYFLLLGPFDFTPPQ